MLGSSPRLRGTRISALPTCRVCGIIPALAGNTICDYDIAERCWDHPRACGEHVTVMMVSFLVVGSSPRLRGTPHGIQGEIRIVGIIPALAGNTWSAIARRLRRRDHPRACGEHKNNGTEEYSMAGSSPRLRGTRRRRTGHVGVDGIIPALAGNTSRLGGSGSHQRDHPRACGEHFVSDDATDLFEGSSPRLRGTRHSLTKPLTTEGIIPALAGNT